MLPFLQSRTSPDDVSVIVADLLPADCCSSWAAVRADIRSRAQPRGLLSCFAPPTVKHHGGAAAVAGHKNLRVVADMDMWEEHAAQCEASARRGLTRDDSAMQALDRQKGQDSKVAACAVEAS